MFAAKQLFQTERQNRPAFVADVFLRLKNSDVISVASSGQILSRPTELVRQNAVDSSANWKAILRKVRRGIGQRNAIRFLRIVQRRGIHFKLREDEISIRRTSGAIARQV